MPKTYQFDPNRIDETNDLNEAGDEDVDVTGSRLSDLAAGEGDTVIWRYNYREGGPGYLGTSDDKADIEDLHFYGAGTYARVRTTLRLLFAGGTSSAPLVWEQGWGANQLQVSNQDNVLGNLNKKCVCGFEIRIEILRGHIEISRIDFLWEVNGLTTCPCDEDKKKIRSAGKKTAILKSVKPDDIGTFMDKVMDDIEKRFHADKKIKRILEKKDEKRVKAAARKAPPVRSVKTGRTEEEDKTKKALVIVGALTGNEFVDLAMHDTAVEAENDFKKRGYVTERWASLSKTVVENLIRSGQFDAFCFVGHGSDPKGGDSADGIPGHGGSSDSLWPNDDEVIDAYDVQKWLGGHTMDVVILHACAQGKPNTGQRWRTAFGVSKANFHSWSGLCSFDKAYLWQHYWF
jgi:hypothetical protein